MREWTDEELSAHLDAALDAETEAALEAALSEDAALAARFEALAGVDATVKIAFDAPLAEAIPARFSALLTPPAAPHTAQVVELAARRAAKPARAPAPSSQGWKMAMAASLALVIGAGGGFLAGDRPGDQTQARIEAAAIDPGNPLFDLLESTPSGQTVAASAAGMFTPVLSFQAKDGRFCREFETGAKEAMAVGVACRKNGGWKLEILLAAADRAPNGAGYAQASGYNAQALEAAMQGLGAADPLSAVAEAKLIAKGWAR